MGTFKSNYQNAILILSCICFHIVLISAPDELHIEQPNAIYFDLPELMDKVLEEVYLWVYINPTNRRNVTQIFLYSLVHNTKDSEFPVKEFLRKKKRSSRGWQRFNVINQVEKWFEDPSCNKGLVVEAFEYRGRNVIVMPSSSDNDGYVSFIIYYLILCT